ncbi:MAG: BBP7 family outer membrane beta-barrel protein [Planctomycetales bacterium]|nr:BBP7 family outer membrane beta-barrel protein [Planctomycetales bacterium]
MRRTWFHGLALALGITAPGISLGQYTSMNTLGASSYPVAPQSQSILQNLPQVPGQGYYPNPAQSTVYQTVAQQQMVPGPIYSQVPAAEAYQVAPQAQYQQSAPSLQPVPADSGYAAPGCQSCQSATGFQPMPAANYGYQSMIAPAASPPMAFQANAVYTQAPCAYTGAVAAKPMNWFGGGGVLLFNRIDDHSRGLSFSDATYAPDVLTTGDAQSTVAPGFETTLGRYFRCGKYALAATYWGIFPPTVERMVTNATTPGSYRSRIPFAYMTMPDNPSTGPVDPYAVYDWFDNSVMHSIERSYQFHNVEVNLLGFAIGGASRTFNLPVSGSMFGRQGGGCGYCGGAGCGACSSGCGTSACAPCATSCGPSRYATGPCCLTPAACGSRCNVTWLAGIRYLRFTDHLQYAASLSDANLNRGTDDLYYLVNTTNNLVGFQLGNQINYCVGKRFNLYSSVKGGIFGNQSSFMSSISTNFQNAYLDDTRTPVNTTNGQDYSFDTSKTRVAFMGELGTGLGVRVTNKWTANVGYRALFLSGVATSVGNVRDTFANYAAINNYYDDDCLILHGFNFGALYNF